MKFANSTSTFLLCALYLIGAAPVSCGPKAADALAAKDEPPLLEAKPQSVELRGRVVCLPEALEARYGVKISSKHEHVYGLKTADGTFYTFIHTRYAEAIFADARVREKELMVKGFLYPRSHLLEVMSLRTLRNGVLHDLYYYCAICEIYAVEPGICECCQGATELVEKPL